MLSSIYRITDYLAYLVTSKSRHGIHSPFVFDFYNNILLSKNKNAAFDIIEVLRRKMIHSKSTIDFVDFGGGKKTGNRQLSEIASSTAKEAKYGRVLYRLVQALKPQFAIELGTATGISTLYQACALSAEFPLHSIEASEPLSKIAQFNAEQADLKQNITFHTGKFETVLPQLLNNNAKLDYAFVDGNHQYTPTIQYFDMLIANAHTGTVFVFDDINWSEEMKHAWSTIKNDKRVSLTIDIFTLGFVFFMPRKEKEHFVLRY
jgi:predicted O-methyltransferase YrrM